jgi:formylmethanofuran dehydrogenase subunit E
MRAGISTFGRPAAAAETSTVTDHAEILGAAPMKQQVETSPEVSAKIRELRERDAELVTCSGCGKLVTFKQATESNFNLGLMICERCVLSRTLIY